MDLGLVVHSLHLFLRVLVLFRGFSFLRAPQFQFQLELLVLVEELNVFAFQGEDHFLVFEGLLPPVLQVRAVIVF